MVIVEIVGGLVLVGAIFAAIREHAHNSKSSYTDLDIK